MTLIGNSGSNLKEDMSMAFKVHPSKSTNFAAYMNNNKVFVCV